MPAKGPLPNIISDDGVLIEGLPLHLDARQRKEFCFLSHAGVTSSHRHARLLATQETITLREAGSGSRTRPETLLVPPLHQPFFLGRQRLELLPAGRLPGAASLLIQWEGRQILYAGPLEPTVLGKPPEVRKCDILILPAFGPARDPKARETIQEF